LYGLTEPSVTVRVSHVRSPQLLTLMTYLEPDEPTAAAAGAACYQQPLSTFSAREPSECQVSGHSSVTPCYRRRIVDGAIHFPVWIQLLFVHWWQTTRSLCLQVHTCIAPFMWLTRPIYRLPHINTTTCNTGCNYSRRYQYICTDSIHYAIQLYHAPVLLH